ncbi:helix-turn-helix domain-containing protein [Streptomyces sp. NPDC059874]|uniref:helix-turn-helix domain-containing protein n=1 Tax=Streptomyces sp. NPDC059874 TaxID=3346983 RepID=UPI003651733F
MKRSKALTPTERAIRIARRVLTGGQWFLIMGLVFYSLMTTTPFVGAHSEWEWSGFVLGLIVDAAFIMALSAESTLARHGVTQLGGWPVAFRWFTGLSSVFLNVWVSVSASDWVGMAVHLIAPALVMLLAEVGPVYMAALADAEKRALSAPQMIADVPLSLIQSEEPQETAETPEKPNVDPVTVAPPMEAQTAPETVAESAPKRLSNREANALIEKGWRHKLSPDEVGKAAGRHPATVRRKYAELDVALSI